MTPERKAGLQAMAMILGSLLFMLAVTKGLPLLR